MKKRVSQTQKALNLWAVILIIWSFYRAKFRLPEWFDEFIAKPAIFVFPVYYYLTKIEKRDFLTAIDLKPRLIVKDLLYGLVIGLVFLGSAIVANYTKYQKLFFFNQSLNLSGFGLAVLMAIATGVTEEILSRGFVLKKLYEESKNIYTASFFASILFFFIHVPILFTNLKFTGNLLLTFMTVDMVLSLALSYLFLTRKSLALPIILHALYNIVVTLFV